MTTRGTNRGTGTGAAATEDRTASVPDTPVTGTAEEIEHRYDDSPESLREEIERTRHELGETVAALAAKTDVRAQAKGVAQSVMSTAATRAQHLLHPAEGRAGRIGKARIRRVTSRGAQIAEHERAARRGGMIVAVGAGLALLGLLLYGRQTGATGTMARRGVGLAEGLARGTRGRFGTTTRYLIGGTRHIAPGLEVHTGRGVLPGMGRRRGMPRGTRRIAPGLHVRSGRGLFSPGMGRRLRRSGMLGGTRRIAPGLDVRTGRGMLSPGVLPGMGRRRGMPRGTRRIAPGLHVRSGRGLFSPGMGRRLRRSGMLGGTRRIGPGLDVRTGRGMLPSGVLPGMGRQRGVLSGAHRIAPGLHIRSGHGIFTPRRARRITPGRLVQGGVRAVGGRRRGGWL